MCRTFDETFCEWRVTQAHIELLSIPEQGGGTRIIRVVRTGNYEIRIFRVSHGSNSEPAIWMELFDHTGRVSVDSSRCREIEDTLVVFREFVARAKSR